MAQKRVNKAEELMLLLSLRNDFNKWINKIRTQFGIPDFGFSNQKDVVQWREKNESKILNLYLLESALLKLHKMPPTPAMMTALEEYILLGEKAKYDPTLGDNLSFVIEPPQEGEKMRVSSSFVRLYIFDTASRKDTLRFIQRNWKYIKFILEQEGSKKGKRIKAPKDKERDRLILNLYGLPDDIFRDFTERPGLPHAEYKEIAVSNFLAKDGIKISPEAVKKVVARYRRKSRDT
jgi:hypothetical protein